MKTLIERFNMTERMPAFSHDIKELVLSGINVALEHGAQLLKPCFAVSSFYCRLVRSCHTSAKNAGRRTSCCFSAFMNILYSHTQILFIHTWTTSPTLYLSFHNVNEQTTICRVVCTDFAKYSNWPSTTTISNAGVRTAACNSK